MAVVNTYVTISQKVCHFEWLRKWCWIAWWLAMLKYYF